MLHSDTLSGAFFALSDPTRRGILARLATGEATVQELAEPFDMTLAGVSKHLKVLQAAGLVTQGRDGQHRPCRLQAGRLRDAAVWLADYRTFWDASMDRLEDYIATVGDPPGEG